MAKSRTTRQRRHTDRHGHQPPTVTVSAACDLGRCAACKGEVLSLLAPVGAKCQHPCHQRPGVAA